MLTASVDMKNRVEVEWKLYGGRNGSGKRRVSAAAVRTRIAAVELLDVEFLRRKRGARVGLRARRAKIAFVGGVTAPFAEPAPKAAERARDGFWNAGHQSSPCAAPV